MQKPPLSSSGGVTRKICLSEVAAGEGTTTRPTPGHSLPASSAPRMLPPGGRLGVARFKRSGEAPQMPAGL